MTRWHRSIGLAVGSIATVAFAWYAAHAMGDQDLSRYASARSLLAIAIATFFYASIIPISAWAWRRLLIGLDVARRWRELVEIMAVTQMAKYIPGNVGVHLGRAGMSLARGIPSRPLLVSMLFEALLAVVAAFAVGLAGIASSQQGLHVLDGLGDSLWMAALGVVAVLAIGIGLRWLAFPLLKRFAPRHAWILSGEMAPKASSIGRAFSAYAVNYVFIGIGISLMARVALPGIAHDPALLCASFALAWVAGFFTPGAPAGLGVREGLMLIILATSYAAPDGLFIVIAFRLATMLGDALLFLTGYALLHGSRKRATTAPMQG